VASSRYDCLNAYTSLHDGVHGVSALSVKRDCVNAAQLRSGESLSGVADGMALRLHDRK